MPPNFLENVILHIEDTENWVEIVADTLCFCGKIKEAYGGEIAHVKSIAEVELPEDKIRIEVDGLVYEASKGSTLVSVVTAQVARSFLEICLPGVIISDTSFPLNGKKVVEWIRSHGFEDYALIGLSGTPFDNLDSELKRWFGMSNARYLFKGSFDIDELRGQVIRNRLDNMEKYRQ